jgi:hypothetical protein
LTPLGVSERVVSTLGIIQAKLMDRKRSGASRKFSPAVKGRQSISPANFTGTEVPWKSCGAHERVRSASLEILIRCCLLWGEEATRLAALSAGLFFLGGRRSSLSHSGKERSQSCRPVRRITPRLRLSVRLEEADRTLPSSFTRTSIQSLEGCRRFPASRFSGRGTRARERREKNTHTFGRRGWAACWGRCNFARRMVAGEFDQIGWDADVLCLIEVKICRSRGGKTPDAALNRPERRESRTGGAGISEASPPIVPVEIRYCKRIL